MFKHDRQPCPILGHCIDTDKPPWEIPNFCEMVARVEKEIDEKILRLRLEKNNEDEDDTETDTDAEAEAECSESEEDVEDSIFVVRRCGPKRKTMTTVFNGD